MSEIREAIKQTEPLLYNHISITQIPATYQALMERLVADHGKPSYYQKILMAAFYKMENLIKMNQSNCESLTKS